MMLVNVQLDVLVNSSMICFSHHGLPFRGLTLLTTGYVSRFKISLVQLISYGTGKTKLAILAFLCCGQFVKTLISSCTFWKIRFLLKLICIFTFCFETMFLFESPSGPDSGTIPFAYSHSGTCHSETRHVHTWIRWYDICFKLTITSLVLPFSSYILREEM